MENKQANIQKRDTTFKQEHGAVSHALKRRPTQAIDRAVTGAGRLLAEDQAKQALNVLTLVKPILASQPEDQQLAYWQAMTQIQLALGNQQAAARAQEQAQEISTH